MLRSSTSLSAPSGRTLKSGNAVAVPVVGSRSAGWSNTARPVLPVLSAAAADMAGTQPITNERGMVVNEDGTYALSAPPPFSLQDLRNAIPEHCWKKDTMRSVSYLIKDVAIVAALVVCAYTLDAWWAWPLYWFTQGTMFWALFCVGHDCGHQSFSNNRNLNDLVGNITHASILVPYHGWRISHRTHHANHGHCENDESWTPFKESEVRDLGLLQSLFRFTTPWVLFTYPFYLMKSFRGSHYDPSSELFAPGERNMVLTSNAFMIGMLGVLATCTHFLGLPMMANLYFGPYLVSIAWLSAVTYLHHHGPSDPKEKMPWYRGEEWSYFRGGLTTIDRDFGIFNGIHHNIETHVIHHLFSQMPHYNLVEATDACKKVMGPYYREPEPCKTILPFHLIGTWLRSYKDDHYVKNEGGVVFYKGRSELGLEEKAMQ